MLYEQVAAFKFPKFECGFTIISSSIFLRDDYIEWFFSILKNIGIDCVFAPGASLERTSYMDIQIEPLPFEVVCPVDQIQNKDITCSFVGETRDDYRSKLSKLADLPGFVIKERKTPYYFLSQSEQELWRREYNDILGRSRYSLCPRGLGPGSVRFWESLQAGAIPILIADHWKLPDSFDWDSCTIRVYEQEFNSNPFIVSKKISLIEKEQENKLRQAGLEAYVKFSGAYIIKPIEKYYGL